MIVFLNGPFGIGKTTAAHLLVERLPHTMLYDPEEVGTFVRRLVSPVEQRRDYQDHAFWRALCVEVARLLRETYCRTLVVPMAVWRRDYFESITEGLRGVDPELVCLRLTASEEVLRRRILGRPDADGPHAWCLEHLHVGLAASCDPFFGLETPTDDHTPEEVVDAIVNALPKVVRPP